MANNRSISVFNSRRDLASKVKKQRQSSQTISEDQKNMTKQDIINLVEYIHSGKQYVKDTGNVIINKDTK
ncbi:hypothetical protein [Paraclostridium dentum]|uniref:hypothetical protein n=1 Tax=Paraclostridium dentum TaxID=2662455 RepID=UPI003F3CA061